MSDVGVSIISTGSMPVQTNMDEIKLPKFVVIINPGKPVERYNVAFTKEEVISYFSKGLSVIALRIKDDKIIKSVEELKKL